MNSTPAVLDPQEGTKKIVLKKYQIREGLGGQEEVWVKASNFNNLGHKNHIVIIYTSFLPQGYPQEKHKYVWKWYIPT